MKDVAREHWGHRKIRRAKDAGYRCDYQQHRHSRPPAHIAESAQKVLPECLPVFDRSIGRYGWLTMFRIANHGQPQANSRERNAIGKETTGQSEQLEPNCGGDWSQDPRELKLRRVQSDRVRQVLMAHQIEYQRHVRRPGNRHTASGHKRKHENHPHLHNTRGHQQSECQS